MSRLQRGITLQIEEIDVLAPTECCEPRRCMVLENSDSQSLGETHSLEERDSAVTFLL